MNKPINLVEIKRRESAATKGPWFCVDAYTPNDEYDNGELLCISIYEDDHADAIAWSDRIAPNDKQYQSTVADMDFIANAREDIPALIAEVERLRNEIDYLKRSMKIEEMVLDVANQNIKRLKLD